MRRVAIIILSVIVAAILFIVLFTFRARQYESVMLDRFGKLIDEPVCIKYGWYLCWPTDRVVRLDRRLHLYQSGLEQTATRDGDTLSIQVFAAWKITEPKLFYRSTGGGNDLVAQKLIDNKVVGSAKGILARYTFEDFFNNDPQKVQTGKLEDLVCKAVNEDLGGAEQGIAVVQVGFARMAFPPQVAANVYDRMSAERNKQGENHRSAGESRAAEIREKAKSLAETIKADAGLEAADIRTKADQEALRITAAAQKSAEAMAFYRFLKEIESFKAGMTNRTILLVQPGIPVAQQVLPPSIMTAAPATQPK